MASSEGQELLSFPCLPCRENHLKCDRVVPTCGRCRVSGQECRITFKFKSRKGPFRTSQKWLRTPKRLKFVDETRHIVSGRSPELPPGRESDTEESLGENEVLQSPDPLPSGRLHVAQGDSAVILRPPDHQGEYSPSSRVIITRSRSANHGADSAHCQRASSLHSPGDVTSPLQDPAERASDTLPALPLETKDEAFLFRHYIQRLAISLDVCDPQRHFEQTVPRRAGRSRTLLNAMFGLAARHLSQTSRYDSFASNRYHDECLRYLIPRLSHASAASDENLFAATIILRMLEEFDVATMGEDNRGHLLGIQAFVRASDHAIIPGTLRAASYWIGLRQEIYSAMMRQAPVKINMDHRIIDRSFEPTDDYTWANRAIAHLADVLNYCFGDGPSSPAQWASLDEHCRRWAQARPISFDPFYYKSRLAPAAFPEVWQTSSCHVIGIQHHIMAQLFLLQYDPSIPLVGPRRSDALREMTHRIDGLIRWLCGLGTSNQWCPPALFCASMGIAMFGDRFDDRADQEALLDLLRTAEVNHARPTRSIQEQLKRAWGWVGS